MCIYLIQQICVDMPIYIHVHTSLIFVIYELLFGWSSETYVVGLLQTILKCVECVENILGTRWGARTARATTRATMETGGGQGEGPRTAPGPTTPAIAHCGSGGPSHRPKGRPQDSSPRPQLKLPRDTEFKDKPSLSEHQVTRPARETTYSLEQAVKGRRRETGVPACHTARRYLRKPQVFKLGL